MKRNFTIANWLALICIFLNGSANAITVYFDNANRGPSDTLQIGGITISGLTPWGPTGQPATVAGAGLGSATVGPINSVDWQVHFAQGSFGDTSVSEGLRFSVDGVINSITIVPYYSLLGSEEPLQFSFPIMIDPRTFGSGGVTYLSPDWFNAATPYPSEITYNWAFRNGDISSFDINLIPASEWGTPNVILYDYLAANNFPDATFQFGFTIESLDYTPAPEPGTLSLAGLGLCGWLGSKLKLSRRHSKT